METPLGGALILLAGGCLEPTSTGSGATATAGIPKATVKVMTSKPPAMRGSNFMCRITPFYKELVLVTLIVVV